MLVISLLSVAAGVFAFIQAKILSQVISQVFLDKVTLMGTSNLLFFLLLIFILRAICGVLSDFSAQANARRVKSITHRRLLDKIQVLGPVYVSGERTGEINHVLDEGIEQLDPYFSQFLPSAVQALLIPLTVLAFVLNIDLLTGIIFLVTAPLIPFFLSLIGNKTQVLTRQQRTVLSRVSAYFLDVLQGLATLKILGQSKRQVKMIRRASEQFREATMRVLRVTFLSSLTLEFVTTLSTAVAAVQIGLRLLYGEVSYEQALTILLLAPEFYLPLRALGGRFHARAAGVEAITRISEILETPDHLDEKPKNDGNFAPFGQPTIRFCEVSAAFEEGRPSLNDITFEIPAGRKVALVGPSGAGKSTIAMLLLRFVQPKTGKIFIDSTPLEAISADDWRKRLSWVPQRPYLLNESIEDNIRLARPDASHEMVVRAARLAEAEDFIENLPQGYQTRIGERGSRLSAGEAQRIALARAFLREADIIILDEATASLDAENEASILRALHRLLEGRTALVIAHRLNTIRDADQIIVMSDGMIRETGTHEMLMTQEGLYRQMWGAGRISAALGSEGDEIRQRSQGWTASLSQPTFLKNDGDFSMPSLVHPRLSRLAVFSRLIRLAGGMWGWAVVSVLAGAATVLSGVGLMGASAYIITMAALQPSIALLQVPIVAVRFFGISRGIFRYLERISSHQATFKLLAELRVYFYQALEPHIPARSLSYRSGDLLNRIVGDVQSLENFYVRALAPPLSAALALAAVFALLGGFDSGIAASLAVIWAAAGVLLPLAARGAGKKLGTSAVRMQADLNAERIDSLQGLADLLAFGQNQNKAAELNDRQSKLLSVRQKFAALGSLQSGAAGLLANLGMWVVLGVAIPMVNSGELNGVFLAAVTLVALTSFEALTPFPAAAQYLESNLESGQRLFEIADSKPEILDPPLPVHITGRMDIEVCDLKFRYPNGELTLDQISFRLEAGKRMAIVGESGSGKSTLLNLLMRLWEVDKGSIRINGSDIQRFNQDEVRAMISSVQQQPYLFGSSILDNLRIANPESSNAEIFQAAEIADIHEFILRLPQGYDTWVGEQGLRLSSGERQRLAIARSFIKPGLVVLMDEVTSNLDPISERKVIDRIFQETRERSLLMVSHRLVGMEAMDEILVLKDGKIRERGKHAELLAAGGIYQRMWLLQKGSVS